MRLRFLISRASDWAFIVLLLAILLTVPFKISVAQTTVPHLIVLKIGEAKGGGPPSIRVVSGLVLFKLNTVQAVSGSIQGDLSERITQVFSAGQDTGLLPITTIWKMKTAQGTIEGYYSGIFNHLGNGTHVIHQRGEIITVPSAYIHLYRAEVFYRANLSADHMKLTNATLMIAPR